MSFELDLFNEIDKQGIYPVLEDVLSALRANSVYMEQCNKGANTEWAAEVFDAVLCAFDLDYENATAADRISAVSMAIRNLEALRAIETKKSRPAIFDEQLAEAEKSGVELTGLCTIRDVVYDMFNYNTDKMEMFFQHQGKRWSVQIKYAVTD